jgi:dTDP-4-dehydrorhamnose reductase
MKVMIVGCNGQLGFALNNALIEQVELLALSRQELDITNENDVNAVVESFKPDILVNAAAYTACDDAEKNKDTAYEINALGPCYLSKACNEIDAVIIHVSTDYVFDGKSSQPYTEDEVANPLSVYGKTKLEGEYKVIKNCSKHIILRTSWVFGEYGWNFVKTMLRLGKEKDILRVVSDQWGAPTYAGDIAKAILTIISKVESEKEIKWGVYHFSGSPYVSWFEFAEEVFKVARKQQLVNTVPTLIGIKTEEYPTPAPRPMDSRLNLEKINREFSIAPSDWISALDNIKDYIE